MTPSQRQRRKYIKAEVKKAKSSFYHTLWFLGPRKKAAILSVYAIAHHLDEIADSNQPRDNRILELKEWRTEIAAAFEKSAKHPLTLGLQDTLQYFDLPRHEFEFLIEGLIEDVRAPMIAPNYINLKRYCRKVAGSIGNICLHIFGATDPEDFAFAAVMSEALQLTNILRDVREDALLGRCYIPREILDHVGITEEDVLTIARNPNLLFALSRLSIETKFKFDEAHRLMRGANWFRMIPAWMMMEKYEDVLNNLERKKFNLPFIL